MKKIISVLLVLMMALAMMTGCTQQSEPGKSDDKSVADNSQNSTEEKKDEPNMDEPQDSEDNEGNSIILSTTTSTQDSGLLDYLLPVFTAETGIEVKVISVGTGKAIQMGKDGEADVLLVHSTPDEIAFVEEGHSPARYDVMYNDFILVGPVDDPAKIKTAYPQDIVGALKAIADGGHTFVSRADDSGTHKKELKLWEAAGVEASGDWYVAAGQGMGPVLTMADEMKGYTISDRATYLSMKDSLDLEIVTEGDEGLFNQYGVLVVDPGKNDLINAEGALTFQNWILSDKVQELIADFGKEEYGQSLFVPNAK